MTVFLTTHNMDVANEMCDRIAIINKGKIIKCDTPDNLRTLEREYQTINLYLSNEINPSIFTNVEGIKTVSKVKDYYHVIVSDIDQAISGIIKITREQNIKINKINTPEPSLEEVFINAIKEGGD
jgi:ABC-2 type transport system ATP-binding protein